MAQRKQPDMLTITQAAKSLNTTRQAIWDAIKRGRLRSLRFGHMHLIPRSDLEDYSSSRLHIGGPKKGSR